MGMATVAVTSQAMESVFWGHNVGQKWLCEWWVYINEVVSWLLNFTMSCIYNCCSMTYIANSIHEPLSDPAVSIAGKGANKGFTCTLLLYSTAPQNGGEYVENHILLSIIYEPRPRRHMIYIFISSMSPWIKCCAYWLTVDVHDMTDMVWKSDSPESPESCSLQILKLVTSVPSQFCYSYSRSNQFRGHGGLCSINDAILP